MSTALLFHNIGTQDETSVWGFKSGSDQTPCKSLLLFDLVERIAGPATTIICSFSAGRMNAKSPEIGLMTSISLMTKVV
jgi:hypothetical protein